jgi:ATPase subunit of ABC transporter with duplicated ATPase domains
MLVVKDLRIDVGPVTLLDGVSFSLQPGDKVGLVGRNGAGKSTLMKTLMGMHSPAAGTISLSGEVGYFSQESEPPDLEDVFLRLTGSA